MLSQTDGHVQTAGTSVGGLVLQSGKGSCWLGFCCNAARKAWSCTVTFCQVPVQKQVMVPQVTTIQKHVEVPQVEYVDQEVEARPLIRKFPVAFPHSACKVPVQKYRHVPQAGKQRAAMI